MDFDLKPIVDWLTEFVALLQNPSFLIFFCSLIVGGVIKNTEIPIPNWLIPSILAFIGLAAGAIFLGTGLVGRVQGALTGMTLALASTGAHQLFQTIKTRLQGAPTVLPHA